MIGKMLKHKEFREDPDRYGYLSKDAKNRPEADEYLAGKRRKGS